jgi:hypothetical protein
MPHRKPLPCAPAPCGSCPYRRDTPPGVWDASEYEKLREYAEGRDYPDGVPHLGIFLCHQTNALGHETVCRGWLTVEQDSLAVRLALCRGEVTPEQVYADPLVPLYATGEEAAIAGLAGVPAPSVKAERVMRQLRRKGAGK